jgi:hypothetical protein
LSLGEKIPNHSFIFGHSLERREKMRNYLMVVILMFLAVMILPTSQALAQTEVLQNGDIIEMAKSHISESVILQKIASSECNFDTSTKGLTTLMKAGVKSKTLDAMMKARSRKAAIPIAQAPSTAPIAVTQSAVPGLPADPGVYYSLDGKFIFLEKARIDTKTKGGIGMALNPLGSKHKKNLIFDGAEAPIQVAESKPVFYICGLNVSPRDIKIYILDQKKKTRETIAYSENVMGDESGPKSDKVVKVVATRLPGGIMSVTPSSDLSSGEYALDIVGNSPEYDFGVKSGGGKKDK